MLARRRTMHVAPPIHCIRTSPDCTRRGYKTAVVPVAHRLCRILIAMLRDGTDFSATRAGLWATKRCVSPGPQGSSDARNLTFV